MINTILSCSSLLNEIWSCILPERKIWYVRLGPSRNWSRSQVLSESSFIYLYFFVREKVIPGEIIWGKWDREGEEASIECVDEQIVIMGSWAQPYWECLGHGVEHILELSWRSRKLGHLLINQQLFIIWWRLFLGGYEPLCRPSIVLWQREHIDLDARKHQWE